MTLVQRGGLLLFTLLVVGVLVAPSVQARRTDIHGGDGEILVFSAQAATTTQVTSTVNIPVGATEGLALYVKVTDLDGGEEIHLTRLERIRADSTVQTYPVAPDVAPVIIIPHAGVSSVERVYSIPFTEGIESCTYTVTATTGSAKVTLAAVTQ